MNTKGPVIANPDDLARTRLVAALASPSIAETSRTRQRKEDTGDTMNATSTNWLEGMLSHAQETDQHALTHNLAIELAPHR